VDTRRRRELTRYGAPAAFLAAVTIAVLLIKSALSGGNPEVTIPSATASTQRVTRPASVTTTTATATARAARRYYTIQPGDTLGAVAVREHTTVDDLLRLNPGIDPTALHSGQRIRVG
jgi:LysM repeat protein